ncbi:MAG: hypothetical protein IIY21_23115 [Clostridiales bacterium]|nr:hypothetical protein [Clostridiales bacterium]
MTRAEILNCLTDRPCDVCKFHESGKCERWECVFEEKPDDAEPCEDAISMSVIEDIKAEIGKYRDNFILANRHDLAAVAENCLMFIDKHISGKESE